MHVIVMDQAAHHLDLFFENEMDPHEVIEARRQEMDLVEDWVRQGYETMAATAASSSGARGEERMRNQQAGAHHSIASSA